MTEEDTRRDRETQGETERQRRTQGETVEGREKRINLFILFTPSVSSPSVYLAIFTPGACTAGEPYYRCHTVQ